MKESTRPAIEAPQVNGVESNQRVAEMLRRADRRNVVGNVAALVVPAGGLEDAVVSSRVYKNIEGNAYDTVVVIASADTSSSAGRINIWSLDRYGPDSGAVEVNDRLRNELCDEDDDIFVSNEGHSRDDGIRAQLPFLTATLGTFRIVPIVMGAETPEFCRELGNALSEVINSQRILIVAVTELESTTAESIDKFSKYFASADTSRLFGLIRSGAVKLRGGGPLMAALIAAGGGGTPEAAIVDIELPGVRPGAITAVLSR